MRTLILMVVLAITAVPAVANEIDVGGTKLVIPTPPGFAPVTPRMANLQEMLKTLVPSTNVQYVSFIDESLVEESLDGEIPPTERWFAVQTTKKLANRIVTAGYFEALRDELRTNPNQLARDDGEILDKAIDDLNERVEEATGTDAQARITNFRELGVHTETDRVIATSVLLNYAFVDPNGQTVTYQGITTNSIVHVRGKAVFLYAFAEEGAEEWNAQEALEWSRSAARDWTDAVLAANPPDLRSRVVEAMPSWLLGMNWASVATNAAIGGVVGLVLTLWNRRRRKDEEQ